MTRTLGLPTQCQARNCEAVECFYCGNPLSRRHEHDHFPVPARAGGAHVVSACYNCHDLKDRMPLIEWPYSAGLQAVTDLCAALRISLAGMTNMDRDAALLAMLREVIGHLDLHETPVWLGLSTPGRLLFAKAAAMMTADSPVTAETRSSRRVDMARWVDFSSARYSDDGPTTPTEVLIAAELREMAENRPGAPEHMVFCHERGQSVARIAADFRVSRDTVYRVLKAAEAEEDES